MPKITIAVFENFATCCKSWFQYNNESMIECKCLEKYGLSITVGMVIFHVGAEDWVG